MMGSEDRKEGEKALQTRWTECCPGLMCVREEDELYRDETGDEERYEVRNRKEEVPFNIIVEKRRTYHIETRM